jgi:hypothetical protein
MPELEPVDHDLRVLDRDLAAAAAPDPAAIDSVRERVRRDLRVGGARLAPSRRIPRLPMWAVAAALLVCVSAGALGTLLVGKLASPDRGLVSTVIPPASSQQEGSQANASFAPQGQGQGQAAPAGAGPAPSAYFGGPCASAPTVQFQGRGLAATGVAAIAAGSSESVTNLQVSVQEHGSDAATVVTGAQAKLSAAVAALVKAGVPESAVQRPYFSSYGDSQTHNFYAYGSIQAQVSGQDLLAAATAAVLQVPGVQGYSTSSGLGGQPTASEVQAGVAAAAGQAKDMAAATARAAGVTLGGAESVVTQPPSLCYGNGIPQRVVQVTITYAIK